MGPITQNIIRNIYPKLAQNNIPNVNQATVMLFYLKSDDKYHNEDNNHSIGTLLWNTCKVHKKYYQMVHIKASIV